MATFSGARKADANVTAAVSGESGLADAIVDAVVVALIAAGFVTLALNAIARL
jgi:hypothetical protein